MTIPTRLEAAGLLLSLRPVDGLPLIQTFGGDDPEAGAVLYAVRPTGEARRVLRAGPNGDIEFVGRLR